MSSLLVITEWPLRVGWESDFLTRTLLRQGINEKEITYCSLLTERPYAGLTSRATDHDREAGRVAALAKISSEKPAVILALGELSLSAVSPRRGIDKWQASILHEEAGVVIPCFPMDRLAKDLSLQVWLSLCAKKAAAALKEQPKEPRYDFLLNPPLEEALAFLRGPCAQASYLSVDIETGRGQINTVGFAINDRTAIAINVLPDRLGEESHYELWGAIRDLLESDQPKILQNFIYETLFFSRYGIRLRGVLHDTMIAQKFLWPEFEMGLDAVGRMYTDMPYWKDDGKSWNSIRDWQKHYEYNCLWKDTKVVTEDGMQSIENLVAHKYGGRVLSWSPERGAEFRHVTRWLRKREKKPINWVRIEIEGLVGRKGLFVTEEHRIMTPVGYKEAGQIRRGDFMLTRGTRHDAGTILGTVLGDSSLQNTSDPSVAYLSCGQTHHELIRLKQFLFGGTVSEARKVTTAYGSCVLFELYVPATPQLARLKKADLESILGHLTPMGIALWFMDDGCQQKGKYPRMKLALQSYTQEEREQVKEFFVSRYVEAAHIDRAGNLNVGIHMSRKLCAEIGPFVPPTLRYKLAYAGKPFSWAACEPYKSGFNVPINTRVLSVARETKKGRYAKNSYCISVEGNENFFTEYGVVANCKDTVGTFRGYQGQLADLESRGLSALYYGYVVKLFPAVAEMCSWGFPVSTETLKELKGKVSCEIEELTKSLAGESDTALNPRSPTQVKGFLRSKGYAIPKKYNSQKKQYQESTDEKSLKKLRLKYPEDKSLDLLLRFAKLNKAYSSYLSFGYDTDNRMRYSLNCHGTETGRWSGYGDPWDNGFNPQTTPGGNKGINIKNMFHAEHNFTFMQIDLKQAESRFVAYDSADANLIVTLENATRDIHKEVAAEIYKKPVSEVTKAERQLGKKSGHGANYSMKEATFQDSCISEMDLVLSRTEANRALEAYHTLYPGIRRWHSNIRKELAQTRCLRTPLGRERYFYGRLDEDTFRQAYAYKPQATIPDIVNHLMLFLMEAREAGKLDFRLLLQCHDSLLLEVPEGPMVSLIAETARNLDNWHPTVVLSGGRLRIPISIETGVNWGDLHEYRE